METFKIPLPTHEQIETIIENIGTTSTDKFEFVIDKVDQDVTPYGINKQTGEIWGRSRSTGRLVRSVDNGDTWINSGTPTLGQKSGQNVSIDRLLVTPNGNLLASTRPVNNLGGWIYRSTDGGATWTEVYDWANTEGAGSYILNQAWDIHPNYDGAGNPAIYVAEYTTSITPIAGKTVRVLRSIDDGVSFQVIHEEPYLGAGIRHWHFVIYDEFDNKLWLGSGDNPEHCKLYHITNGSTVQYVNGGTFDWKFVSVVPYKGVLYCPSDRTDANANPCPSYIYNKRKNKLEVLDYESGHSWYSTINKKYHLPFWITQVGQDVSNSGHIKGYTADYYGSYEILSVPALWAKDVVPSAMPYSYGDYIYISFFSSTLNPTSTAFVRVKITERSAK